MIDTRPTSGAEGSGFYAGRVIHQRLRPRRHRLGYRVFNLLLDLDEIDRLAGALRLFSRNRFNVFSFHDGDHGDGSQTPLRLQIERMAKRAGVAIAGGQIRLLCMPRVFGYVFNPLSVYFCQNREDRLACIVYEVSNTFGQRHSYVIPIESRPGAGVIRQSCAKAFYVSPFLDMDLTYRFEIRPPGERVGIAITVLDGAGPVITTAFSGTRRVLSDTVLARAVVAHPLVTLKVMAGIHWEAIMLWIKGVKLRPRPPAPGEAFTPVTLDND